MNSRGYRVECIGTVCIVHAMGTIDIYSAEQLQTVIADASQRTVGTVIVSFADCSFGDSSFLKILIQAANRLEGRLLIVAPANGMLRRMLHVTSLSSRFTMYDTLDAAYLALTSDPKRSLGELAIWTERVRAVAARPRRRARCPVVKRAAAT